MASEAKSYVKTFRRIEITAFRHCIIMSALSASENTEYTLEKNIGTSEKPITRHVEAGSEEGREILLAAIRILEEQIAGRND